MNETVKLYHQTATSCSAGGVQYDRGEEGAFEVHPSHVPALMEHGFTTEPAADEDAPKGRRRKAAQAEE